MSDAGKGPEPTREQLDAMRFLDGEMHDVERTRYTQNLEQDPASQELVDGMAEDRQWFGPERGRQEPAPDGMVAAVMARLADEGPRGAAPAAPAATTGASDPIAGALHWTRSLMVAALILLGVAAALFMGRLADREAERLEAAPDRVRIEMEKLDEQIRFQRQDSPGAAGRER